MQRKFLLLVSVLFLFVGSTTAVSTIILYDGAVGGTPDTQGLYYQTWPLIDAAANQTFADGVTILDTTPVMAEYAGYATDELPALERQAGYSTEFTVQIVAETHVRQNRAGFGVTILGEDLQGIALNFWQDEIWASEGGSDELFEHAEGVPFDTTAALIRYNLVIEGESYMLFANENHILSGPLRDYTAFEPPPGFPFNPYTIPSSLGLGDNTTSASTQIKLAYVGVTAVASHSHTTLLPIITQ